MLCALAWRCVNISSQSEIAERARSCNEFSCKKSYTVFIVPMVVVQSTPSTSSSKAPRKNRRTLSKKKAPPRVVVGALDDRDHEMNNNMPPPPGATERTPDADADKEILIDVDGADVVPPTAEAPSFGPAPASAGQTLKSEMRRVVIPPHRMSPLKRDWINIFGPLTEILGLQVRMNVQRKGVEMRVRPPLFLYHQVTH